MKKLLLLLIALVVGLTAGAQRYTVESNGRVFTIKRSGDKLPAQTVRYRTVALSAFHGQHFTSQQGELNFAAGQDSLTVSVAETNPVTNYYRYQRGPTRNYRFEVLDLGGNRIAHTLRYITTGSDIPASAFDEKEVDVFTNEVTVHDNNYIQAYHAVSIDDYFDAAGTQNYHKMIGDQLYMTVGFDAREVDDGYQHIQILVNNTSTCDEGAGDNNPGTLSLSHYMACFVHEGGTKNTNYAPYLFPVTSAGDLCGTVTKAWSGLGNTIGELRQQKFRSNCRSTDGRLIIPADLNTLGIRFDASGNNEDDWKVKNVKAYIHAIDDTPPAYFNYWLSGGYYAPGTTVYVSVAFNEIVITSNAKLSTSWGQLSYHAGSGSNVLTFSGDISAPVGTKLTLNSLSGTIKDLGGKDMANKTINVTADYATVQQTYYYNISYDLDGGSVATQNPATYNFTTATFTLVNPKRTGYRFDGWTGSNGDTPQLDVTIEQGTFGDLNFTAHWTDVWGMEEGARGTEARPYTITSTAGCDLLESTVRTNYAFTNGKYFVLDANIDYEGAVIERIGSSSKPFMGIFDGQGHVVSHFSIGNSATDCVGFFGGVNEGTIKNLIMADAVVNGNKDVGVVAGNLCGASHGSTPEYGRVENCHVFNSTVNGRNNVDRLVGDNSSYGLVTDSHYRNVAVNGGAAESDLFAVTGTDITTSTPVVTYAGTDYYLAGDTVTLACTNVPEGYQASYTINGTPIEGDTFVMPAGDVTVTFSTSVIQWAGTGTEADPYVISYPTQLDLLATRVNEGNDYQGCFFVVDRDLAYTPAYAWDGQNTNTSNNYTPIGLYHSRSTEIDLPFNGSFDGRGHTIRGIRHSGNGETINCSKGLFGMIGSDGVVKNVTLTDTRFEAQHNCGGIAAECSGAVLNCHVTDSVAVTGYSDGSESIGGIVGLLKSGTVSGCTSSATVKGYNYLSGIVGYSNGTNSANCTISDNFVYGATIIKSGNSGCGIILGYRLSTELSNNYYYGCTLNGAPATNYGVSGGDQGGARGVHKVTLGDDISATGSETVTYDGTPYYADGSNVTFTYSGELPENYNAAFIVTDADGNDVTLLGNVLKMPAYDVTVTVEFVEKLWEGSGTASDPYVITTPEELDKLASNVNIGTEFENTHFVLGNDIAYTPAYAWDEEVTDASQNNYTPIGGYGGTGTYMFNGIFDGRGYTISGIRCYYSECHKGLFGYLGSNGQVMNVRLTDSRFSATYCVGGIVGSITGSGQVINCVVTDSVAVTASGNVGGITYSGGVVGMQGSYYGKIIGCISSATVIGKNNSGGIVGYSGGPGGQLGTVKNCFVYGANLILTNTDDTYGAIAGKLTQGYACLSNNYYYGCTLNGEPAVNFGAVGADGDGARGVHKVTLGDNISATGSETVTFDGTLYYADGCNVTLSYSGEVPDGQTLTYTVDGEPIEGDTFVMPAKDVVVATTLPDVPGVPGDLNGDGDVDVSDVNILINLVLENITTAEVMGNPDLDGNNTIDIGDVNALINLVLN
ncbi:MAG: InlB B-repeat-containing protein [Muribaculaceae bacterium]|nr:InlB B-repeat-containing protein [Muribaculaceae bacterium]